MFDDLPKQPEDIFEKTDEAAPHVAPPTAPPTVPPSVPPMAATPVRQPQPIQPPSQPTEPSNPPTLQPSSESGGHLKTIVIVVAILVVICGAFLISWRILSSRTPVTPQEPGTEETTKEAVAEGFSLPEEAESSSLPEVTQPEVDTDKDGLSDLQEAQLGTSSMSSDTDGDFLFDLEELEVYGTNPLNSDSDGDGFLDGNEVKAGYDPNGPGKLLEVPSGS